MWGRGALSYGGPYLWKTVTDVCSRAQLQTPQCILKREKACFGDGKNDNVSISPLMSGQG